MDNNNQTATTILKVDDTEVKYERANRVAITSDGDGFKADFYRTHKHLLAITSNQTGWTPKADMNKSAQREDFREFITQHAADIQIEWKPEDMRADNNKRIPKYTDDDILKHDAINLVSEDITAFADRCPYDVAVQDISVDSIAPMTVTPKGTKLESMGIHDGKYLNGNWAWATVSVCTTLKAGEQEIYVTMDVQLVSGQLKKPAHIDNGGYTQTAWNANVKTELVAAGIITEDIKEETTTTEATDKPEKTTRTPEAPEAAPKTKRPRKPKETKEKASK